jgi:RNA polymerase sigma-70 factor (ECF subfamily)
VVDSTDICQSVLGNFFVRAAAGQFDLDRPEALIALLVTMARNKVRDQARRQHAERRDQRRLATAGADMLAAVVDAADSPSQIVAGHELLEAVHSQLSDDERFLANQRAEGRQWGEIATDLNASPEALRKKLARALDRVTRTLGLIEIGDA